MIVECSEDRMNLFFDPSVDAWHVNSVRKQEQKGKEKKYFFTFWPRWDKHTLYNKVARAKDQEIQVS